MPRLQVMIKCPKLGNDSPARAEIFLLKGKSKLSRNRKFLGRTNSHGFTPELPSNWTAILIIPLEAHWSTIVRKSDLAENQKTVWLPPYDDKEYWWRTGTGCADAKLHKIKIGIVDVGFPAALTGQLERFNVLPQWPLRCHDQSVPLEDVGGHHGFVISALLAYKPILGYRGLAHGATVYFANIAADAKRGSIQNRTRLGKLYETVEHMVRTLRVNLISISTGFDLDPSNRETAQRIRALDKLFKWAREQGTICVCAAGNDPSKPVMYPAKLDSVLAVGGLGPRAVAPAGSYVAHCEAVAAAEGKASDVAVGPHRYFLDPYTSRGEGLNCIAPSVGIVLPVAAAIVPARASNMCQNDTAFQEFDGTSFGAPIIVGLFACLLDGDSEYWACEKEARYLHALDRVKGLCHTLNFELVDAGEGFPCLV